jgi:hypothetical protein
VKGLLEADAWLTLPAEADVVLSVDCVAGRFSVRYIGTDLCWFGDERPHLSAGYSEASIGGSLTPDLALAKRVAVALVVVAGGAGREEVGFDVPGTA